MKEIRGMRVGADRFGQPRDVEITRCGDVVSIEEWRIPWAEFAAAYRAMAAMPRGGPLRGKGGRFVAAAESHEQGPLS